MAKIFSWKIKNKTYAYLVEENGSYIRNKITDDTELLRIASIVDGYNLNEYISEFEKLKSEVESKYNVNMGTYDKYYDTDTSENTQYVILTGKDGDSFNRETAEPMLTEQDYNRIVNMVDDKIEELRSFLEETVESLKNFTLEKSEQTVTKATSAMTKSLNEINNLAEEMESAIESAKTSLAASKTLLEMEDGGLLTYTTLNNLINDVNTNSQWITNNKNGIAEISNDYTQLKSSVGDEGTGLVFNQMLNQINQCDVKIQQTNASIDTKINTKVNTTIDSRVDDIDEITERVNNIVSGLSNTLQATTNRLDNSINTITTQLTTLSATTYENIEDIRGQIHEISGKTATILEEEPGNLEEDDGGK